MIETICFSTKPKMSTVTLKIVKSGIEPKLVRSKIEPKIESKQKIVKCPIYNVLYIPIFNVKKEHVNWSIASIEDFDKLSKYNYHLHKRRDGKCYVNAKVDGKNISMHTLIMGSKATEGYVIDHINSNGLDNRRCNLRFATLAQNAQNRIKEQGKYSSDYTGVSFCQIHLNYRSTISYDRKYIHIGRFKTELEAAKAYDVYAIHYYGVHGKTNNLLSNEEIDDIKKNGIFEQYKKKTRDLPKNIYRKGKKFSYDISRNFNRYYKLFDTMEEAIIGRDNLFLKLNTEKEQKLINSMGEISRNKNGDAVIYLRNRNGDVLEECIVDDGTWTDLSMYKWSFRDDGYCAGNINGFSKMMHIYLYEKYKGKIPLKHTIDHINQTPLDNRLDNLRTASRSLQSHNQKKVEGSICKYKGVTINGNRFVVNSNGQRSSFVYMEDAARKYNEVVFKKYGKDANLNEVFDTQTTVQDLIPDNITVDYIRSIKFVELFKQVIKKKGWGGRNGHFSTKKIRITTLNRDKEKAIKLLGRQK